MPSTTWLPVSRMKLFSSREPNCDEVSCNTANVIEKMVPATVIIELAMVETSARAPAGSLKWTNPRSRKSSWSRSPPSRNTSDASSAAPNDITPGINQ